MMKIRHKKIVASGTAVALAGILGVGALLQSITAVNNGLRDFKGVVIFASHDHEIVQTVANRIIEITPDGCIDRQGTYEEFLDWRRERGMKSFIE